MLWVVKARKLSSCACAAMGVDSCQSIDSQEGGKACSGKARIREERTTLAS